MKKLYCYVDESGQDAKSEIFVVVAVVTAKDQDIIRKKLIDIEREAKTNKLKWHKTRHDRRLKYLTLVLDRKIETFEEYLKNIDKVSIKDVQDVARELFQKSKFNLQIIGPFKSKEPFEKILR